MPQTFGISCEVESSWSDALPDAHQGYILAFIEMEQAREEAVVSQFLAAKELYRLRH